MWVAHSDGETAVVWVADLAVGLAVAWAPGWEDTSRRHLAASQLVAEWAQSVDLWTAGTVAL